MFQNLNVTIWGFLIRYFSSKRNSNFCTKSHSKGKGYIFDHVLDAKIISKVLSKIIHPVSMNLFYLWNFKVKSLNSVSAYKEFLAEKLIINNREMLSFKFIGIFHRNDELKEEMETFKNFAWQFSLIQDTFFGLVYSF